MSGITFNRPQSTKRDELVTLSWRGVVETTQQLDMQADRIVEQAERIAKLEAALDRRRDQIDAANQLIRQLSEELSAVQRSVSRLLSGTHLVVGVECFNELDRGTLTTRQASKLARDPTMSYQMLAMLARDKDPSVRANVAGNVACPLGSAIALATDRSVRVRAAVSGNSALRAYLRDEATARLDG